MRLSWRRVGHGAERGGGDNGETSGRVERSRQRRLAEARTRHIQLLELEFGLQQARDLRDSPLDGDHAG